jgi:hypothetical protein
MQLAARLLALRHLLLAAPVGAYVGGEIGGVGVLLFVLGAIRVLPGRRRDLRRAA